MEEGLDCQHAVYTAQRAVSLPETPEPGFYAVRFARGAPFVACRIVFEDGLWVLFRNGEMTGPPDENPWKVRGMHTAAFARRRIDEAEYDRMLATAASVGADDPLDQQDQPVDLRRAPPVYRRKEAQ